MKIYNKILLLGLFSGIFNSNCVLAAADVYARVDTSIYPVIQGVIHLSANDNLYTFRSVTIPELGFTSSEYSDYSFKKQIIDSSHFKIPNSWNLEALFSVKPQSIEFKRNDGSCKTVLSTYGFYQECEPTITINGISYDTASFEKAKQELKSLLAQIKEQEQKEKEERNSFTGRIKGLFN